MWNKCIYCGDRATEKHHIIPRSSQGSDHPYNLADLCRRCHYAIHSGTDSGIKEAILQRCYQQLKQDLTVVWNGTKCKPPILRRLEND